MYFIISRWQIERAVGQNITGFSHSLPQRGDIASLELRGKELKA